MVDPRWKPVFFAAAVIIGIFVFIMLSAHRSDTRVCKASEELYYTPDSKNHDKHGTAGTGESNCYLSKSQGPCDDNMILIPDAKDKNVGVCDCDNINNDRTLVYNEEMKQCHFVFTQAYCLPGQWLRLSPEGSKCEQNICGSYKQPESSSEWVPLKDGSCAELGKHDYSCMGPDEVIRFFRNKLYPACSFSYTPVVPEQINLGSIAVPSANCPENHSRTRLGHCALDFDFD